MKIVNKNSKYLYNVPQGEIVDENATSEINQITQLFVEELT